MISAGANVSYVIVVIASLPISDSRAGARSMTSTQYGGPEGTWPALLHAASAHAISERIFSQKYDFQNLQAV